MRLLRNLVIGLLLLVLIATLVGFFWMRSSRPDYNAALRLPGLSQPVEVFFDDHAIPHIYAQNEQDLFMALGYVHAQDRLFQMEMIRRLADGRLSEVFGDKTLSTDRLFRTMGFREHARSSVAILMSDTTKPYVQAALAYLRGVNLYVAHGKKPVEFSILGMQGTPFTLEDVEVIVSYMGYSFTGAFKASPVAGVPTTSKIFSATGRIAAGRSPCSQEDCRPTAPWPWFSQIWQTRQAMWPRIFLTPHIPALMAGWYQGRRRNPANPSSPMIPILPSPNLLSGMRRIWSVRDSASMEIFWRALLYPRWDIMMLPDGASPCSRMTIWISSAKN
jgi:hypothetical protein